MLKPISDKDLEGKGIADLPDIPGLSAAEMKHKFEEIVRDVVITNINDNVEELNKQIFINPDGVEYLTVANLVTSIDAILSNTDPKKVPSAIVIAAFINNMNAEILKLKTALDKKYIVFRANGGTGTMNQVEFVPGMALPENAFTKVGASFSGWSTSANGIVDFGNKAVVSAITTNCGANVLELFAVWG